MAASNKWGNMVLAAAVIGGTYTGFVYIPPYIDDYNLKQLARAYISGSRWENEEEKAKERFKEETARLGIPLQDDQFKMERINQDSARVNVHYTRDVNWPFTQKKKTFRYNWTVTMKYKQF